MAGKQARSPVQRALVAALPVLQEHDRSRPGVGAEVGGSEDRARVGIDDTMVRVALGIEDTEDLIADFAQALEKI